MRLDLAQNRALVPLLLGADLRTESERALFRPRLDDLIQTAERAAADKQDVGGVDLDELLMRMLAAALRRNVCNRALQHFQQCLLNALTADIAGDGRIFALPRDFINFIDINNTALCTLDVEIRRLNQTKQDVLDVLADIAGLRQRRCIRNRKRDIQRLGKRLREQGFARAGRTDQKNVALLQFDIVRRCRGVNALVMVVDRDAQRDFCAVLSDHVLIQRLFELLRRRQCIQRRIARTGGG